MKIIIIGAKGMLGTDLLEALNNVGNEIYGIDIDDLDITDLEACIDYIKMIAPNIVINCAAYTNVDGCEAEAELAYKVNALGPRNIAIACNEVGASMVHISTDYVFDGAKGESYNEYDNVNPLSIYGKTKLDGEKFIQGLLNRYYIIRTQWLFGKNGKNFARTMINASKDRDELSVVNDQFGSPTYTMDLANAIKELIETKAYGIYHITNTGIVSWFEFTKSILEVAGIQGVNVLPITTREIARPAPRPAYSPLNNFYWRLNGFKELRGYKEALKEYVESEFRN